MSKYEGHTPGPWKVSSLDKKRVIEERDSTMICECVYSEGLANARLIADAPMLAEQNEKMLNMMRGLILSGHTHKDSNCKCDRCKDHRIMAELIAEVEASHDPS